MMRPSKRRHLLCHSYQAAIIGMALLLTGCKSITLVPEEISEDVQMVVRCTASTAGTFSFAVKKGDGALSEEKVQAPSPPYQAQVIFTPNKTGRSREGDIYCYHSDDEPGKPVNQTFIVRETVEPNITQFVAPESAQVGQPFDVLVDITDDPKANGEGDVSGLDKIYVNTTGPITGPGDIELAGVSPGPPDGVQGPKSYDDPISFTCTAEGEATIKLIAVDAAGNEKGSSIHKMECYP